MREIKFRVWDNDAKRMLASDWLNNIFLAAQKCLGFPSHLCAKTGLYLPFSTDINMQYTGLKDKNGIEIYEGDILHGTIKDLLGQGYQNGIVKWGNYGFIIDLQKQPWEPGIGMVGFGAFANYEVIGNIYENPELLQN